MRFALVAILDTVNFVRVYLKQPFRDPLNNLKCEKMNWVQLEYAQIHLQRGDFVLQRKERRG